MNFERFPDLRSERSADTSLSVAMIRVNRILTRAVSDEERDTRGPKDHFRCAVIEPCSLFQVSITVGPMLKYESQDMFRKSIEVILPRDYFREPTLKCESA